MYYINACSTISHQASFQNTAWTNELESLTPNSEVILPNFKEFVDPPDLRRMSKIIRMGIACSKDCLAQSKVSIPEAIIVGTGLGCLTDTEKFLQNALTIEGLIPPTSFIQSTHNTIAGQISLALKNHNYNMTHTQNSLSFEHALLDGILCLNEDNSTVLIGAADENIPLMDEIAAEFGMTNIIQKMTTGASFFVLSTEKNQYSKVQLIDTYTIGLNNRPQKEQIELFLAKNKLTLPDIDLILFNSNGTINADEVIKDFSPISVLPFEKYCGYYFTNVAFGMHLATEILANPTTTLINTKNPIKTILLYNNYNNKNIGLTLLKSIEA